MKRVGGLFERIADRENLMLAFCKARRGQGGAPAVLRYAADLDGEFARLRAGLAQGDLELGHFERFEIRDPKPRVIHAPPFRERVLHHALMNLCEPRIERYLIDDTFACRRGRGTSAALERAREFARRHHAVLKLDIARYFDSIDHAVLLRQLARLYKERRLLELFERIVASHHVAPGKGLPIGTLTSQHFASLYLGPLDHHVKQDLRCAGYVRYMDDFLLFGDDRAELRRWLVELHTWLGRELRLTIKPSVQLVPTTHGVPFLGFRVWPTHLTLSGVRRRRFAYAVRGCARARARGALTEDDYARRLTSLFSHAARARSHRFRSGLIRRLAQDGLPMTE